MLAPHSEESDGHPPAAGLCGSASLSVSSCGRSDVKVFARVLLSWNEPRFFLLRIRGRKGWMLRLLLFLAIAAAMGFGFYADFRWGKGPARSWGVLGGRSCPWCALW
jgi:hypothetical protein